MCRVLLLALFYLIPLFNSPSLDAAYLFRNGKFINTKDVATLPVEEHYQLAMQAIHDKNWNDAIQQLRIVTINFPESSWAKQGLYFLGVSYFHADDMDLANQNFSEYLQTNANPEYFEEIFRYKLAIADAFKKGHKRHLFGYETLPQWMPDSDMSVVIYDEIIQALANHEIAGKALLAKADYLRKQQEFRKCTECLQNAIRRFPKSEFASKAYVQIAKTYLNQASLDAHNPDILALAEINRKKFAQDFPRDPKIEVVDSTIGQMKEVFAKALYDTGALYERKKQPKAAVLYYHSVTRQFPETLVALACQKRLTELEPYAKDLDLTASTH